MMKLTVTLSAAPNPDFSPNEHPGSVRIRPRKVKVGSLAEASAVCRQFIRDEELGGGNWTGGEVLDEAGNFVARISYNGRAWITPGPWTPNSVEAKF